ncbi:hypothetical protein GCM10022223_19830 [Kineosporia mesophila]|uniref:Uncharacterized protein n=1 Tax=Kineosporia mesophila TaxID=566012 RepID=A0ABP6ZCE3_9ACTN|nr:hypothetical protein [Kineosporia mesophila]MCD5353333.1 hypothetical protein [Kineosporia mesophila]
MWSQQDGDPVAPVGRLQRLSAGLGHGAGTLEDHPDPTDPGELDIIAANRSGRATGLTTFTPLPRLWSPVVRAVLRLKSWSGPDSTLRRLSFIHVAYWVMVDRFPGESRKRRYSYLMFVSNFNGSWLDYIDAFSRATPQKMVLLWGSAFGFPGPMPPRPFTDYIRGNDWRLAHYFSAYPGATATEIASALRVRAGLTERLPRPQELDDAQLVRAWRGLLADVQRDL